MLACQRDAFSLPQGSHYLNCAYMSPLSRRVVAIGLEAVQRKAVPFTIRPRDFFQDVDRSRALFAQLVHVPAPERIAVIPSVSYGLAQVARNTAVERGQEILLADEQFPSNVYIWHRIAAERGGRVVVVKPPVAGRRRAATWNEAILEAISGKTAVVALAHVHWTDGTRFDLEAVRRRADDVGAALVVDGTQSVGAMPFDVQTIRPDALVCAAYKWLMGPYSVGVAYFGPRYDDGVPLEETWIGREGSDDFSGLVHHQARYRGGAIRYDMGEVSNFALMPMLVAALEQVLAWGPERIQAYGHALSGDLIAALEARGLEITDVAWRGGHLFGIRLPPGMDPRVLKERLESRQVYVSVRGSAVRVSLHVFNDTADVDALGAVLLD